MRVIRLPAVIVACIFLAACAGSYSSDPEIKSLQIWSDTCFSYKETLKAVNDMIELEILSADEISIARNVREFVGPLCEMANPPLTGDREAIQKLIDTELIKLIKLRKGLE